MKFSKDDKLKDLAMEAKKLEDEVASVSQGIKNEDKEEIIRIKQPSKVSLLEMEPGVGNTTNQDGGPKKCVGCGKVFQTLDERQPGYVLNPETQDYCLRCFKIKHYNRLVEQEINDQDFIAILEDINKNPSQIRYYYVVDLFDLPGSRLEWLERLIGQKEVVLVVNKIDLLPKSVSHDKIRHYVERFFSSSPIAGAKVLLTSSFKNEYVYLMVNELKSVKYDQYIVGVSNAGKSSLINACLRVNQQVPSIVTSKYVNTTLDKIKINFTKDNYIYDTPGLVKHNHIAIATAPSYWDFFFFQKEVKQITFQLNPGQTVFYGGLAWMTYVAGQQTNPKNGKLAKTSFHFYANRQMPLHRTKAENGERYFRKNRHSLSPRLKEIDSTFTTHTFKFTKTDNVDIHVSGLGWINIHTFAGLELTITVPDVEFGIKVNLLPAMINS